MYNYTYYNYYFYLLKYFKYKFNQTRATHEFISSDP
jgi:hypothetical protein